MFACPSSKGHTAYMLQTIASNKHKGEEKTLFRLLKWQPAVICFYSLTCRNIHLSICLMQCPAHKNYTLHHLIYYREEG